MMRDVFRFAPESLIQISERRPTPRGIDIPWSNDSRFEGVLFSGSALARNVGEISPRRVENRIGMEYPCEEETFLRGLLRMGGLDPAGYRMQPLIRRLPACLRALRVPSIRVAKQVLKREPQKLGIALASLLIGTTSFFRDTAVFQCLDESVIPEILPRRPRPRVWSAACSEGLELYSVAMLLARHGALEREQLLGTDFRAESIAVAQRGIYSITTVGAVPPDLAAQYLVAGKTSVAVAPAIHGSAHWKYSDLLKDEEPGPWDMILCRNLSIYLEPRIAERLWSRLSATLVQGGVLVVGKAEKPRLRGLQQIAPCIYRKTLATNP